MAARIAGLRLRGPIEQNGSCATVRDWLDPARTNHSDIPHRWVRSAHRRGKM